MSRSAAGEPLGSGSNVNVLFEPMDEPEVEEQRQAWLQLLDLVLDPDVDRQTLHDETVRVLEQVMAVLVRRVQERRAQEERLQRQLEESLKERAALEKKVAAARRRAGGNRQNRRRDRDTAWAA